jgi:hypothetical protein
MSEQLRAAYDRYLTTFATRDPEAIVALHSPDSRFWQRTGQDAVLGREAIATAFGTLFAQWPDLTFEVREVHFGPDFWVLDWILDSQGRSGRIRFDCLDFVTVDGAGLVKTKTTYVDLAQAQQALVLDADRGR